MLSNYLERGQKKYCHGADICHHEVSTAFQLGTNHLGRRSSHAYRRRLGDVGGRVLTTSEIMYYGYQKVNQAYPGSGNSSTLLDQIDAR